jgi:ADP-ribose pyrophosphatase
MDTKQHVMIPKSAKCVFKGVIFDVYQWKQKQYDGTFKTFEMLKRPDTVEAIAILDGKIAISEQEQPLRGKFYGFFGGRAERGEKPLIAAKRELLEESGLKSNDWELLLTYRPVFKIEHSVFIYAARDCRKVAELQPDAGERLKVRFVTFDELLELVESDKWWGDSFKNDLFRMRYDGRLEGFRKKLFK